MPFVLLCKSKVKPPLKSFLKDNYFQATPFLPAEENEDERFMTGCRIKLTGEHVLKGLQVLLASVDEPIPSQLYEEPKNTGKTEFTIP